MSEEIAQIQSEVKNISENLNKHVHDIQQANEARNKATEENLRVECDKLAAQLQDFQLKAKSIEDSNKHLEKLLSRSSVGGESSKPEAENKYRQEFVDYLRKGHAVSADASEEICKKYADMIVKGKDGKEAVFKTLLEGNNPDGGYFVRPDVSNQMVKRIFETSPMRSVSNVVTTTSDELEMIIDDDEAASGGWVGEVDARPETGTPQIGLLRIPVHELYAQPAASQRMLDDAGFDIEAWLQNKVTSRLTRDENTSFVTGNGSQKPKGFLTYAPWAAAGVYQRNAIEQISSVSTTGGLIEGDDIQNLQNALIEDYQPNAVYAMNRQTFSQIMTLKDSQGQYIYDTRFVSPATPMMLKGKPVVLMNDMPVSTVAAPVTDALAVAYGDFSVGYTIVDRMGFRVIRDVYSNKPFVLFYTTKRVGGAVTNYESIKLLKLDA